MKNNAVPATRLSVPSASSLKASANVSVTDSAVPAGVSSATRVSARSLTRAQGRPSTDAFSGDVPQLYGHRHQEPYDAQYCKSVVRNLGLKVTQQRLVILEQILNGRDHVTAQDVFDQVVRKYPEIGFATVYRFLRTLTEQGYTTELRMRGLPARYEWAKKQHHDHMTCLSCGLICEFENDEIESLQQKVADQLGFKLSDHVLELYGTCARCQKVAATQASESTSSAGPSKLATRDPL